MKPARGLCFVRPIKTADTMAGGKIILTENVREAWTAHQAEIVAVGEPVICEDDDCERDHLRPEMTDIVHPFHGTTGDWVIVTPRACSAIGDPADKLWVIPQQEILAVIDPSP